MLSNLMQEKYWIYFEPPGPDSDTWPSSPQKEHSIELLLEELCDDGLYFLAS